MPATAASPANTRPLPLSLAEVVLAMRKDVSQPVAQTSIDGTPDEVPDWVVPIDPAACQRDAQAFYRQCLWTPDHNEPPEIHKEWYRIACAPHDDPMFCDESGRRTRFGAALAAPRGHAKSEVFSKVTPIWSALTGRKRFIVILSDTEDQARNFVDGIRAELEQNERIKQAFPGMKTGRQVRPEVRWTSTDLIVTMTDPETGKMLSQTRIVGKGTGSRLRGIRFRHWRPDLIVCDDLENDELVATPEQRKKTFDWVQKVVIPALDPKRGQLMIVGTILHFDSLLNRMLTKSVDGAQDSEGFDPGRVFIQRRYQSIIDYGTPEARPLWPGRFSLDHLLNVIKPSMTTLAFMQEYQNEPIDESARVVQPEWVKWWRTGEVVLDTAGQAKLWRFRGQPMSIYIGVDPAIEEGKDSDWFAMVVIGITAAKEIVTLYVYRGHLGLAEQVRVITQQIDSWNPSAVIIEANQAQKWLSQEVIRKGRWLPRVKPIKNLTDKFQRLNATAVWWEQGHCYLRAAVDHEDAAKAEPGKLDELRLVRVHAQQYDFYEELMTFPMGKHDDLFDAWEDATKGGAAGMGSKLNRVA